MSGSVVTSARGSLVAGAAATAGAASVAAAIGVACLLYDVLLTAALALFLALALEPGVRFAQRRGLRRGAAVAVVLLAVLGASIGLVLVVLRPAGQQLAALVDAAPALFQQAADGTGPLGRLLEDPAVAERVRAALNAAPEQLLNAVPGLLDAAGAALARLVQGLTLLALTICFSAALPRAARLARTRLSAQRAQALTFAARKVGSYVGGQLVLCLAAGAFAYAVLSLADVPYTAVIAVAVGVLDAVPQIGALLGAGLATLVCLATEPSERLTSSAVTSARASRRPRLRHLNGQAVFRAGERGAVSRPRRAAGAR